jgi:hypothetical protein
MRLLALLTTLVALAQASAVEPASHRQLDEARVGAAAPAETTTYEADGIPQQRKLA